MAREPFPAPPPRRPLPRCDGVQVHVYTHPAARRPACFYQVRCIQRGKTELPENCLHSTVTDKLLKDLGSFLQDPEALCSSLPSA